MLLLSLQENPGWVPTNRFLAACYAHLGELDEAKMMIKRLRALTPVVLPSADNWRDPAQREFYLSGLRLAMSETEIRRLGEHRLPLPSPAPKVRNGSEAVFGIEIGTRTAASDHPFGQKARITRIIPEDESADSPAVPHRHGRACPGHPRLALLFAVTTWVAGPSHAMTMRPPVRHQIRLLVLHGIRHNSARSAKILLRVIRASGSPCDPIRVIRVILAS